MLFCSLCWDTVKIGDEPVWCKRITCEIRVVYHGRRATKRRRSSRKRRQPAAPATMPITTVEPAQPAPPAAVSTRPDTQPIEYWAVDRCSEHSSNGGRSVIGDTTKREVGSQEEKVSGVSIALRRKVWSLIWSEEETRSKPANEE
ncbi:hypothetical protein ACJJTC_018699 [Scirpophaga incertulas]